FVDDLDVLGRADLAIGIGWRAIASDAGKWNPVKVQDGGWHGERRESILHNRVGCVYVPCADRARRILFAVRAGRNACGWNVAQGRRHIVLVIWNCDRSTRTGLWSALKWAAICNRHGE